MKNSNSAYSKVNRPPEIETAHDSEPDTADNVPEEDNFIPDWLNDKPEFELPRQDLIDVDLIKRRAKPKIKPLRSHKDSVQKIARRVLLFPLYFSWWSKRMPLLHARLLVLAYCLQLLSSLVYGFIPQYDDDTITVSTLELWFPYFLIFLVAVLMTNINSTVPSAFNDSRNQTEKTGTISTNTINNTSSDSKPSRQQRCATPGSINPQILRIANLGKTKRSTSDCGAILSARNNGKSGASVKTKSSLMKEIDIKDMKLEESSVDSTPKQYTPRSYSSSNMGDLSETDLSSTSSSSDNDSDDEGSALVESGKSPTSVTRRKVRLKKSKTSETSTRPRKWSADSEQPTFRVRNEIGGPFSPTSSERRRHANFGNHLNKDALRVGVGMAEELEWLMDSVKSLSWSKSGVRKVLMSLSDIRAALESKVLDSERGTYFYLHLANFAAIATACLPILYRACMYAQPYFCLFLYRLKAITAVDAVMRNSPAMEVLFSKVTMRYVCGEGCLQRTNGCFDGLVENFRVYDIFIGFVTHIMGSSIVSWLAVIASALSNGLLSYYLMRYMLVAEGTFRRRLLYAKYFSKLTSSHKAKKYGLPHFRLNKMEHIKVWLSLRTRRMESEREGVYRYSDPIANFMAMLTICCVVLVGIKTISLMSYDKAERKAAKYNCNANLDASTAVPETFQSEHGYLGDWFLILWTIVLSLFMSRFMSLSSKTNKKYKNTSLLLTEQINLYIKMLRKKHLKDELMACNSMLGIAIKLLAELEGGKDKHSKHKALVNPFVYNLLRIFLLSALGTLSSEILGFKVRLWKL